VFSMYEHLSAFIDDLPETLDLLYSRVLSRLESDLGRVSIASCMRLVMASRAGLTSVELRRQLAHCVGVDVPPVVFARLWRSYAPLLEVVDEVEGTVAVANATLAHVVRERYGLDGRSAHETHALLARYHQILADPTSDGGFEARHRHHLLALPFHLTRAARWVDLTATLSNLRFVQAMCAAGLRDELLAEYIMPEGGGVGLQRAQAAGLERVLANPRVAEMRDFVARNLPVIGANPTLVLQQALCEPAGTRPRAHAEELLKTVTRPELTVRPPSSVS
jgi:hypothetical protein